MISLNAEITKKIENNFRKFSFLKKPEQRNLKEFMKGMILEKTCFLSAIGRRQSFEKSDRKNIERYSNALSKADSEKLLDAHLKSKKKWFLDMKEDLEFPKMPNLILVDGGDIKKKNCPKKFQTEKTRKMQYCCGIVDGSNQHKPSWGYKLLNISLYNPAQNRTHILRQHLFSSNAPGYRSDWDEQKQSLEKIKKIMPTQNNIIIEDSIGDDAQRIKFYAEDMQSLFIVRSQNIRKYEVDFNGDKFRMKFPEIAENIEFDSRNVRSYFDKKSQRKIFSKIAYKKVQHADLVDKEGEKIPLFLVLVKTETYNIPMAFLTNIEPRTSEEAWKIFFWYKKRWEVEKIYRDIKQKFKLESALIRSYKAWKTLVVLTALAWEFMQELKYKAPLFLGSYYYQIFSDWLEKRQAKEVTHLNLLDWIREFLGAYQAPLSQRFYSWKTFINRFSKPKNQLSLFGDWKKMGNF